MNLGLFHCRLIQTTGDQLFFFATGTRLATPSLRFLLSWIPWKVGVVSRARGVCAAKRTLDTAPAFHRISMESEGKKTLKGSGHMRVYPHILLQSLILKPKKHGRDELARQFNILHSGD